MTQPIPLVVPGFSLFEQNIPLAITIVVVASFLFAGGATIQHLAVGRTVDKGAENRSMDFKQFWKLITNRRWLLGLATVATGATMHIVGLMMAPVTVVQPVGILAVPWSVLLAGKIHGFKPTKQIWGAVALTIAGIVVFTLFSATSAAPDTELPPARIIISCLVVFAAGGLLGFFGRYGSPSRRCLMWASGGSFFYGPVSYTHLDVYKRQPSLGSTPATRWCLTSRASWRSCSRTAARSPPVTCASRPTRGC